MKKIILSTLILGAGIGAANAGLFDFLSPKKAEPATLEQACSKDEITKVCPEIILGDKTMAECLADNVSSLSKQCAGFVKKQAAARVESAVAEKDAAVKTATDKKDAVKTEVAAKKTEVSATKDEAKAAGAELKDTAKSLKGVFK
jgi:hypothetical protein